MAKNIRTKISSDHNKTQIVQTKKPNHMKHTYLSILLLTLSLGVSAQNVQLVADINTSVTNQYDSSPFGFTEFQGKLYFTPSGSDMPNRNEM